MNAMNSFVVRWPCESFYWAILPLPEPNRHWRRQRSRLLWAIEEYVPVDLEELQIHFKPIPGNSVVACAVDRSRLEQLTPEARILQPASAPDWIPAEVDVASFNLLTEAALPRSVRRSQAAFYSALAIMASIIVAISCVGLERHTRAWMTSSQRLDSDRISQMRSRIGTPGGDATAALIAELRRLRQTRVKLTTTVDSFDAAASIQSLFMAWPSDSGVKIDSIAIAPSAIDISGAAAESEDAEVLASALRGLSGWVLRQPRFESSATGHQVSLQLLPKGGS